MNSRVNGPTLTLAQRQSRFAAKIFNQPAPSGPFKRGEGFAVYRRNLLAVAEAALGVTSPTARRLLGYTDFQALVAELLTLHPPTRGDWAEWGEQLPAVIGSSEPGRMFPFIASVAELDWLRHCANRAAGNQFDPLSAQLLQSHSVDDIGIAMARHVGLTSSTYPLVEILDWHADPAAAEGQLQVSRSPRPVLVYRREYRVEQRYITQTDYSFTLGLRAGRSVGSLLDELDGQDFDFPGWIEQAIGQNLISHLYLN
jgi:hypothetical protein